MYYVTTNTFGQEVVEKVIVLSMRERSYEGLITSVDTTNNYMRLDTLNFLYYHGGTIFVRNGRLIEETSLVGQGKAFAITQPQGNTEVANMIYTTSNGFTSANLADHELYFGALDWVDGYNVELTDAMKLTNNYWQETEEDLVELQYTNTTAAYEYINNTLLSLDAETELGLYTEPTYGYFYVEDGMIDTIYFIDPVERNSETIMTAIVDTVNTVQPATFTVHSANEWLDGGWSSVNASANFELEKSIIIKDGKRIEMEQLAPGDHIYVLLNANSEPHLILIN